VSKDPWDVTSNEARFRATVAAHIAGEDDEGGLAAPAQQMPEFVSRLNLPKGGVWCVVCGVWCVVCGVWCVVCGVWCVVCGVWCVVSHVVSGMCDA